ncbi:MAG: hypothetical protein LC753_12800 [Acidobacteria bacterium]|nr:hypothetical protein [Acidobacteriota bacterium]
MHRLRQKRVLAFACLGAATALYLTGPARASQGQVREFTLTGDHFAFAPGRLEVQKDDLVKITFNAADMPLVSPHRSRRRLRHAA